MGGKIYFWERLFQKDFAYPLKGICPRFLMKWLDSSSSSVPRSSGPGLVLGLRPRSLLLRTRAQEGPGVTPVPLVGLSVPFRGRCTTGKRSNCCAGWRAAHRVRAVQYSGHHPHKRATRRGHSPQHSDKAVLLRLLTGACLGPRSSFPSVSGLRSQRPTPPAFLASPPFSPGLLP